MRTFFKVVYVIERDGELVLKAPTQDYYYRVGSVAVPTQKPQTASYGPCGSGIHLYTKDNMYHWFWYWDAPGRSKVRVVLECQVKDEDIITWDYDKIRVRKCIPVRALLRCEVNKILVDQGAYARIERNEYAPGNVVDRFNAENYESQYDHFRPAQVEDETEDWEYEEAPLFVPESSPAFVK